MSGRKRFQRALGGMMGVKQDKLRLIPAICGAYFTTGAKALQVAGRDDFIWARIRDSNSEVIQVFNDTVTAHWDLPILVYRDPNQPDIWKVYGRDVSRYEDWGDISYLRPHGTQHAFAGGNTGSDVAWIFKRQFMPLMTRPNATATMSVWVESDYYYWDGQYKWWPGSGTSDLSGYKPTGAQSAKYLTLYLEGQSGLLEVAVGDEFNVLWPPQNPEAFIPAITPDEGIPLSAIYLLTGTSQIGWGELFDIRNVVSPLNQTGSFNALDIYEDSVFIDEALGLNFGQSLDVSVSGTIAHIDADAAIPVYDSGAFSVNATRLDFDSNLDVTVSGTFVWINAQVGGAGGVLGIMTWDDGVPIGTGTYVDFGDDLDVSISGDVVRVDASVAPPNKILLYRIAEEGAFEYDVSSGGFATALATATVDDTVWIPPAMLYGGFTIPAGVHVIGIARSAITITGQIDLGDEATIENLSIIRNEDTSLDVKGIVNHEEDLASSKVINCEIICTNAGAGNVRGVSMENDGDIEIWGSNIEANADGGGLGFGAVHDWLAGGFLTVHTSRVHGSNAPFKENYK
jgi:hypothetical protein